MAGILRCAHLDLPTELVLAIVDHLSDDDQTLCKLARTSRALQHIAEEHIYKTIELDTVSGLHAIINAFTYRHERVRAVQTLKLQYHYNVKELGDNLGSRSTFNACVAQMVNLREWNIESPYDNTGHWTDEEGPADWVNGDMECFRAALDLACTEGPEEARRIVKERELGKNIDRTVGLALLDSLTIHSHGVQTDFWDLGNFHCLFRHPSLRYLHVSCISLMSDIPELASYTRNTPLTTLIFDECELSPDSLRAILRTPKRLKHVTLGENVWNTRRRGRARKLLNTDPAGALDALTNVAHSLESLSHLDPSWKLDTDSYKASRMVPIGDGMRNFHALKILECEITSFLHQAFIMNHEIAPPSLQTLRLRRHWNVAVDFFDHPPDAATYLALTSLNTLELVQQSHFWHPLSKSGYICEEERARTRHAYAYKLYKAGINLRVLIELHQRSGIIPPYLHGEALPLTDHIYDAGDIGFNRYIGTQESSGLEIDPSSQSSAIVESSEQSPTSRRPSHVSFHSPPPETDQLGDFHVRIMERDVHNILQALKRRLIPNHMARGSFSLQDIIIPSDGDEEFLDDDDDDSDDDDDESDDGDDDWGIPPNDPGIFEQGEDGEWYFTFGGDPDDSDEDSDEMEVEEGDESGALQSGEDHDEDDNAHDGYETTPEGKVICYQRENGQVYIKVNGQEVDLVPMNHDRGSNEMEVDEGVTAGGAHAGEDLD